jgi:t-SNARE complex subunit (syntaxin)
MICSVQLIVIKKRECDAQVGVLLPLFRVRKNMNTTLTRKFVDEMKAYQQAQQQYKNDIKSKVKRQVQVVKPDATDEDVERVMKSEGGKDALYKEKILAGSVNDQIK